MWNRCFFLRCCCSVPPSVVSDFATPRTAARQASLSASISQSLLKLIAIALVTASNHLILFHPLLLLPSIFPSIRVQGTLKSLLQHHSSKASILRCSAFFMVHLSHPHMAPGKTFALTLWTFVSKAMSLLFNTLFRFVIVFFPKEQSSSAVILEHKKIKSVTVSLMKNFNGKIMKILLVDRWTARRSNQSILKEISPECSFEGLMLKLKLQYFGHLMQRTDSFERPWCWERLKAGGEGDHRRWGG